MAVVGVVAKLTQSAWFIVLATMAVVVAVVHAIVARPPSALNWIGVALWLILLVTLIQRRFRPPPAKPNKPKRRRRR